MYNVHRIRKKKKYTKYSEFVGIRFFPVNFIMPFAFRSGFACVCVHVWAYVRAPVCQFTVSYRPYEFHLEKFNLKIQSRILHRLKLFFCGEALFIGISTSCGMSGPDGIALLRKCTFIGIKFRGIGIKRKSNYSWCGGKIELSYWKLNNFSIPPKPAIREGGGGGWRRMGRIFHATLNWVKDHPFKRKWMTWMATHVLLLSIKSEEKSNECVVFTSFIARHLFSFLDKIGCTYIAFQNFVLQNFHWIIAVIVSLWIIALSIPETTLRR